MLPGEISALSNLEELDLSDCSLESLPEELNALSKLTKLELGGNNALGRGLVEGGGEGASSSSSSTSPPSSFPSSLPKSLRHLGLRSCCLRVVPPFVRELEKLEVLDLSDNISLGAGEAVAAGATGGGRRPRSGRFPPLRRRSFSSGAATSATPSSSSALPPSLTRLDLSGCFLTSIPATFASAEAPLRNLVVLDLCFNRLATLPEDLGARLPSLRELDARSNPMSSVPVAALAGAVTLEAVRLGGANNDAGLQVESPSLHSLVERLPRLRAFSIAPARGSSWSARSRANLDAFAGKLRARDNGGGGDEAAAAVVVEF